ncbi:hypothetical protein PUN28_019431 [Cardiocondyla obscurior]|uniref:Uncharacterized protein n=1 Tax=Cardiocondyla obscurior TaxID=286306 RepID=A0AAW2EFP9_9HYME
MAHLKIIQNRAILTAMGCQRSTPTNIILAESKISSLNFRFMYLGRNYNISKVFSFGNHLLTLLMNDLSNLYNSLTYVSPFQKSPLESCYCSVINYSRLIYHCNGSSFIENHLYALLYSPLISTKKDNCYLK